MANQMARPEEKRRASAEDDVPASPEGLTDSEEHMREEHMPLRAAVLYEIIRIEGEGELARGFGALWWSGLAAGLSIGFSPVAQAALKAYLPNGFVRCVGLCAGAARDLMPMRR